MTASSADVERSALARWQLTKAEEALSVYEKGGMPCRVAHDILWIVYTFRDSAHDAGADTSELDRRLAPYSRPS